MGSEMCIRDRNTGGPVVIMSDPSGGCRFLLSAQVQANDGYGAWRQIIDLISRISIDLISLELILARIRGTTWSAACCLRGFSLHISYMFIVLF